jgi:hypothetical protein
MFFLDRPYSNPAKKDRQVKSNIVMATGFSICLGVTTGIKKKF